MERLLSALPGAEREAWGLAPDGLWLVHRLDVGTSGLVLLARDPETHRALARGDRGRVESRRRYLALVWGRPRPPAGELEGPLGPDPSDRRRMRVVARGQAGAQRLPRAGGGTPRDAGRAAGAHREEPTSSGSTSPTPGTRSSATTSTADRATTACGTLADAALLAPDHPFLHAWRLALPPIPGRVSPSVRVEAAPLPADFAAALEALGDPILAAARAEGVLARPGRPW